MSIRSTGVYGMRVAGAAVKEMLQTAAAEAWDVPVAEVIARDSHLIHEPSGRSEPFAAFATAASEMTPPAKPTLKSADEYTFTHVVNVCILTMSQAEALGFRGKKLYEIGMASALHDAGKLLVPEEILTKPGALTPEERSIMESHTVRGARYILGLEGVPKLSVLAALEHHLRFDGSGYPNISDNWRPNLVSQMLIISDVFDAMRSRRCYKEPAPLEKIIEILESEQGTTFNPFLVKNFLKLIDH